MITPAIALLISALSACIGAGLTAVLMRSRYTASAPQDEESQQRARKLVQLRQETETLRQRVSTLDTQTQHLNTLLGLPERGGEFDHRRLTPALAEINAMKHVAQSVIVSPQGFVLYGDERDVHARSLAAASGIISGLGLWPKLDTVTLSDTLGQRLALHHITDAVGATRCLVGIWSRGADIPESAVARMRAHLGHPMESTREPSALAKTLEASQITQGGALARLVRDAPVVSLLATTLKDELLFKQGTRMTMWPKVDLVKQCMRFFAHRQAQGCGELEEITFRVGDELTLIQPSRMPDDTHIIVEAQLRGATHPPHEAMRHATSQMGWHLKSVKTSDASLQGEGERRTPEAQPPSTGAA